VSSGLSPKKRLDTTAIYVEVRRDDLRKAIETLDRQ
jgi:hypothetical protein